MLSAAGANSVQSVCTKTATQATAAAESEFARNSNSAFRPFKIVFAQKPMATSNSTSDKMV